MPSQGKTVGKHTSRAPKADKLTNSTHDDEPKPENKTKASHHVKNDSGISEMDDGAWAKGEYFTLNHVDGNRDEAFIPKINLGDVNGDDEEYEEVIYGGHRSGSKSSLGPRVTEVIQEDGQMTIEMEVDGMYVAKIC